MSTMRADAVVVALVGNSKPSQAVWTNYPIPYDTGTAVNTGSNNTISFVANGRVLLGGKTSSGEWVDVVVFENWLKWAIETQVFEAFKKVSKPSPLQIENAINVALEAGKQLGGIIRYRVTAIDVDNRNRTASFEWKAQLTNAIHSTTIKGIVTP